MIRYRVGRVWAALALIVAAVALTPRAAGAYAENPGTPTPPMKDFYRAGDGSLFAVGNDGKVWFSTDTGLTWSSQQLPAPSVTFNDGTVQTMTFKKTAAVWQESAATLWVFAEASYYGVRRSGYGCCYDVTNLQIYRALWSGTSFSVTSNQLRAFDEDNYSRRYLSNFQAHIAGDTPILVYQMYYGIAKPIYADVVNPSSLSSRQYTVRSPPSSDSFNGIASGTTREGNNRYLYVWYGYYDDDDDETYFREYRATISSSHSLGGTSTTTHSQHTASGGNLSVLSAFSHDDTYWVFFRRWGDDAVLSEGSRAIGSSGGTKYLSYGSDYRIAADSTRTFLLYKRDATVYAREWPSLGTAQAILPDVDTFLASGTRHFLVRDLHDGKTYYYDSAVAIPDQLNPPSGTYKDPIPTFSWTSDRQRAYQVYLYNGANLVHTSGRTTGSIQAYRIPLGVMQPERTYRVYVRTWDGSDNASVHSTSSLYRFDPRSVHPPGAPETQYPTPGLRTRDRLPVAWQGAYDPDSPPASLRYDLEYRRDGGPWQRLLTDFQYYTFYEWDLSALPPGTYQLRIRANDYYNYSDWTKFPAFDLRRDQPPTVTLRAPALNGWYPSGEVDFAVDYSDPDGDPLALTTFQVSENSGFTAGLQTSEASADSATIALAPGQYYVRARAMDVTGAVSEWSNPLPFGVDGAAPSTVVTRTSHQYTTDRVVQLAIQAADDRSGMAAMQLTTDIAAPGAWLPYQATYQYVLPAEDDTYNVFVRVRDQVGHASAWQSVPVILDATPPAIHTFRVSSGATTYGLGVMLELDAADSLSGLQEVTVSNDGANWSSPMPYGNTMAWMLAPGEEGTRTVHIRVFDRAGNYAQRSASIAYIKDQAPPTVSVTVNAGEPLTSGATVPVTVTAADDGTPTHQLRMRYSVGAANWSGWQDLLANFTVTLPAPGRHTIYVQVADAANNVGMAVGSVYYSTQPDPLPLPGQADALFRTVGADGTAMSPARASLYGEELWLVRSPVLAIEGGGNYQYSSNGVDFAPVRGHLLIPVPSGPFAVWLRTELGDGLYSPAVQYRFLLDTVPPVVALAWENNATATTTGTATLAIGLQDDVTPATDLRVEYRVDDGPWITTSGGMLTVRLEAKGYHTVSVRAFDQVGNPSEVQTLPIWYL